MKRTRTLLYVLAGLVVWTLWTAAWSRAADLNAVASEIAGKPVVVNCYFNADEWQQVVRDNFEPDPVSSGIAGFTRSDGNLVWLSPLVCNSLKQAELFGISNAGMVPFSLALLTFVHEAVHQSGISDEAETECRALAQVKSVAIRHFGLKERVLVEKVSVKRIKGIRTRVATRISVVNPQLLAFMAFVNMWHNSLPANYRKACNV